MRTTPILVLALLVAGCAQPDAPDASDDDAPTAQQAEPDPGPDPELEPPSFDGLDPAVVRAIVGWKKGDPPPAALVGFRDPPPPPPMMCGLRCIGSHVSDYVRRVTDPDLLEALLFDPRATDACARAAGGRLIEVRGVGRVREVIAARRLADPAALGRPEPAALAKLVDGPCARIRVASASTGQADELEALRGLQADLGRGVGWHKAYMRAAYGEPESRDPSARIRYAYAGVITPDRFDVVYRYSVTGLEADHVRRVFEVKRGTHIWESADTTWLYRIEALSP
jgi:hypothetical protein